MKRSSGRVAIEVRDKSGLFQLTELLEREAQ